MHSSCSRGVHITRSRRCWSEESALVIGLYVTKLVEEADALALACRRQSPAGRAARLFNEIPRIDDWQMTASDRVHLLQRGVMSSAVLSRRRGLGHPFAIDGASD